MTATAGVAARLPPPPPLAAAADTLAAALAEHAHRAGVSAPAVTVLGGRSVLRAPEPDRGSARVHLAPASVLIGPWRPDGSAPEACGHCAGTRWQRLRTRTERDALEIGEGMTAVGAWPVLTPFAVEAVWHAYRAALGSPPPGVPDGIDAHSAHLPLVSAVDLRTLAVRTYPILADPLCPTCAPTSGTETSIALIPRTKPTPDTYRTTSLGAYPVPTTALANPVTGALGAGTLMTITSPTTAPVTGSVFIRGYGGLLDVSWSGQANSFAASRDLAFLEGLERYAGTHRRRPGAPILAAYRDVAETALDPRDCGLYEPATYAEDDLLEPFSPDVAIPWVPGWSLRDSRPVLVPRRLAHYSSHRAHDTFVLGSSSGCATGGSIEEAILYGLLELLERDAFLLGWYANARLPRIDLTTCRRPEVRAMVDRAELAGYRILAFDNRIDLGVPVVTSLAVRLDEGPGALSFAAAAHLDPEIAVENALAESLTYLPHLAPSTRRRRAELEAMADDFRLVRRLEDHAAMFGLPRMRTEVSSYLDGTDPLGLEACYRDWNAGRPSGVDLTDDLRYCLDRVTGAGFDVLVVDQTAPEQEAIGLSTVCVIVPGLIPIDFGWARQRALRMPRLRDAFASGRLATGPLRRVPHPFP